MSTSGRGKKKQVTFTEVATTHVNNTDVGSSRVLRNRPRPPTTTSRGNGRPPPPTRASSTTARSQSRSVGSGAQAAGTTTRGRSKPMIPAASNATRESVAANRPVEHKKWVVEPRPAYRAYKQAHAGDSSRSANLALPGSSSAPHPTPPRPIPSHPTPPRPIPSHPTPSHPTPLHPAPSSDSAAPVTEFEPDGTDDMVAAQLLVGLRKPPQGQPTANVLRPYEVAQVPAPPDTRNEGNFTFSNPVQYHSAPSPPPSDWPRYTAPDREDDQQLEDPLNFAQWFEEQDALMMGDWRHADEDEDNREEEEGEEEEEEEEEKEEEEEAREVVMTQPGAPAPTSSVRPTHGSASMPLQIQDSNFRSLPEKIPIDIDYDGVLKFVEINASMDWPSAKQVIAQAMDRHPDNLKLVYTLSWQNSGKAAPRPRSLENTIEWLGLKRHVDEYVAEESSKKARQGHVKAFRVVIGSQDGVQPRVESPPKPSSKTPSKAPPKPPSKKGSKSTFFRGEKLLEPNEEDPEDEGEEPATQKKAAAGSTRSTSTAAKSVAEARLVQDVVKHYMCKDCNRACVVLYPSGKHRVFTMQETARMAQLLAMELPNISIDNVAKQVIPEVAAQETKRKERLDAQEERRSSHTYSQQSASSSQSAPTVHDSSATPVAPMASTPAPTTSANAPVPAFGMLPYVNTPAWPQAPLLHPAPLAWPMPTMLPGPAFPTSFGQPILQPPMVSMPPVYPGQYYDRFSSASTGFEPHILPLPARDSFYHSSQPSFRKRYRSPTPPHYDFSDPRLDSIPFPFLTTWLAELDRDGVRGADRHCYARWGPSLKANGYTQLNHLAAASARMLSNAVEMPIARAETLIQWAQEDCMRLVEVYSGAKRARLDNAYAE